MLTYDPRGVERSRLVGDADPATPAAHAEDLHRLVGALDSGRVDVFASSGGAVNALAWVAAHPDDVATLVAHDPLFGVNMATLPRFLPDLPAVAAAPTRVIPACGEESAGQMTARSTTAVADRLGTTAAVFPGGHAGFLGGEYGQTGEPEAFAATLREVLAAR